MRKSIIGGIIAAVVIAGGVGTFFLYNKVIGPGNEYKKAVSLLEEEDYEAAKQIFADLGDYKDAEEQVTECDYQKASSVLKAGNYEEAKALFLEIQDYRDAKKKVKECDYRKACSVLEAGNYEDAKVLFLEIEDYKDVEKKAAECDYRKACSVLEAGNYDDAKVLFLEIKDYEDAEEKASECDYQKAKAFYNVGDYINAAESFCKIYEYSDSKNYMYSMFVELAGQKYIDECTAATNYLNAFIETETADLMEWAYDYYYGTATQDAWYVDYNNGDLKKMESSMKTMDLYKSELEKVFPQSVIDTCNDETLSSAYNQFISLHKYVGEMFKRGKAVDYLYEIANGKNDTLQTDANNCSNAMTKYVEIINNLKNETVS